MIGGMKSEKPVHVILDGSSGLSAGEAALIGAGIAAVSALLAAILTAWLNHLWEAEREDKREHGASRKARAERITGQLSGLYGPLRLLTAQSAALAKKLRQGKPNSSEWYLLGHLPEVVKDRKDRAIVEQLMQINGEVEKRVLSEAGLLRTGDVPASFIAFLGHYRQLKVAFDLAKEDQDLPETVEEFETYPREFDQHVREAYDQLHAERKELERESG